MSNDLVVLDLSHYQEDPPWQTLLDNGIVGVILKASENKSTDSTFVERYEAARAAGLGVSSYHFLRHGDIPGQMRFYLDTVDPDRGERLCLDWEDDKVTLAELKQAIDYLLNDQRDLQITVYASSSFLQERIPNKPDEVLAQTSLWCARYSNEPPYFPTVWPTWTLWQYTDKANVEGFGPVDGNRFNGSAEQCLRWFGPAVEPAPGPEPEPDEEPEVVVDITTTDGVKVTVNVNGYPR